MLNNLILGSGHIYKIQGSEAAPGWRRLWEWLALSHVLAVYDHSN